MSFEFTGGKTPPLQPPRQARRACHPSTEGNFGANSVEGVINKTKKYKVTQK